ncbi:hypothetical protein CAEBREN_12991 [Caenorhabditis brenneri]|uniref:Uncharacterized protein n=1 Tax=Caenorhabditis brenneri TaxID=135651 RepID=G0PCH8_CAEBE|nr:hypothetical protein CAEBREN_12991 [Caenorhabditis brenneri]
MLKTFGTLTKFIQDFRTSKGRVPEEDFEEMQKVFDNFISQWNLFQFGSDSDQQLPVPETVCHCTQTLEKSRAFQNSKYSDILKYEHKSLMRVSEKLAEFKLTEIISGCPLDFDHNINVDCFERSESTSSEQSCSSSDDSD